MAPGLSDLLRTLNNPQLFFFLAWSDIRARYKRSVLGPFWITLSTAIGVVGLGFIWSELFHLERKIYVPMLSIGLILWQFISGTITESTNLFVRQSNFIKNLDLPISLYSMQLIVRQLFNLAHNIPLFFLVVLLLGSPIGWNTLWAIPSLFLVVLNLFWLSLAISILGARFRDLEYLINTIMPLLMFFSPVMYRPNALPVSGLFIWANPLAHLIELVRFPLLGEAIPPGVVLSNLAMLVIGSFLTLRLFNSKRSRIALWV